MSAVANIVLADAQATPVNHTFIPLGPDTNGVWWFEDQSASSPIGYNRISVLLTRPAGPAPGDASSNSRVSRVKIGMHTPKLETVANNSAGLTPPPTVAYIPRVNVEFILPERGNLQDRKDVRKFMANLLSETQVTAMVETLQNIY
jgi:hypothetical protein